MDKRTQKILDDFSSGMTLADIGREVSLSRERVRQILREQGCPSMRKSKEMVVKGLIKKLDKKKDEIAKVIAMGATKTSLVTRYKVPLKLLKKWLVQNGLKTKIKPFFGEIGDRHGEWTVINNIKIRLKHNYLVLCQCSCGEKKYVAIPALQKSKTSSCIKCSARIREAKKRA